MKRNGKLVYYDRGYEDIWNESIAGTMLKNNSLCFVCQPDTYDALFAPAYFWISIY